MTKNEYSEVSRRLKRLVPMLPATISNRSPATLQARPVMNSCQLNIAHGFDVSSINGRFAWEMIELGKTFMPVIFRSTVKYFCVKMLRKLLVEYPDDVLYRPRYYHYGKDIHLYIPTMNEIELLNKINSHHSKFAYSSEPFTQMDQLVQVSDFVSFYEYLKSFFTKKTSAPLTSVSDLSKTISPMYNKSMPDQQDIVIKTPYMNNERTTIERASTCIHSNSNKQLKLPQQNGLMSFSIIETSSSVPQFSRHLKHNAKSPVICSQMGPSKPVQNMSSLLSNSTINPISAVPPSKPLTFTNTSSAFKPVASSIVNNPSSKNSTFSSKCAGIEKSGLNTLPKQCQLSSGWLQINKLYTPYVSSSSTNHHLYKIPVSLLTFYELLKVPTTPNSTDSSGDATALYAHTIATQQEIQILDELCAQQSIKPFPSGTKLIDLLTFYKNCSTNTIFIKELPHHEPKTSICKEWSSIVQMNGGICRLRNTGTLIEQTVPFIGNFLLKTFILSSQHLSTASLRTPTSEELEFLALITFYCNISANLRNSKLIDIECVKKEYNVDLILLFNDKFPLNVLNYQNQENLSLNSQEQTVQQNSLSISQSTPPPSPHSPTVNSLPKNSQSSSVLPFSSTSACRYQKQIVFHGHSLTVYVCSGFGTNSQRECISINLLYNMFYPNSQMSDKTEAKILRLLRTRNINRYRPQIQESLSSTRLIDLKDLENHWQYIEQDMQLLFKNEQNIHVAQDAIPIVLENDLLIDKSSNIESKDTDIEKEQSIESSTNDKRLLEKDLEQEKVLTYEPNEKRCRLSTEDTRETISSTNTSLIQSTNDIKKDLLSNKQNVNCYDADRKESRVLLAQSGTDYAKKPNLTTKKKIKLRRKKSALKLRSHRQAMAFWVRKYNIDECCVHLDLYRLPSARKN